MWWISWRARSGEPQNLDVLRAITGQTGLAVDYGGGIRSYKSLAQVFQAGASQVSIGSMAVTDAIMLRDWIADFGPDRFLLGADVRDEMIVYHGWQAGTRIQWTEFISQWLGYGITQFFCTDVERDGLFTGPAALPLSKDDDPISSKSSLLRVVGSLRWNDLNALREAGLSGVIIGKALYEGRLDLDNLTVGPNNLMNKSEG
jgi:phosphoribosylformimino-5-aminoimidazole carboxamide ribotide isomerase